MTAAADPRRLPDWKQRRQEERVLLLLGAILDALVPAASAPTAVDQPPATPVIRRNRKTNA